MESGRSAVVILLVTWVVASCSSGESRWAGTITDSAGVAIVSNPEVGLWTEADRWTVEEDLRIGAVEADPVYQFGDIVGITVDSRGRIFVLEGQAQHIKVFSPEGEYEQTIGGRGAGPGELRGADFLLTGPGDTLVAYDPPNQRANLYAPDGSSVGSFKVALEEGLRWDINASSSGAIAEQIRPYPRAEEPLQNPTDMIVIRATDGTITDTLLEFPSGRQLSFGDPPPGRRLYYPEPAWDLTGDTQVVFGVKDVYEIRLYSPAGQLKRVITKPHEPQPITDRDIEVLMGYFEAGWIRAGASAEQLRQARELFHFADRFPAFRTVVPGPAGTIWVRHVLPPSEMSETEVNSLNYPRGEWAAREWDVLDADGRLLGVVTMPHLFSPKLFRGDKIYGIWREELEVQHVLRLRVVGDLGAGTR